MGTRGAENIAALMAAEGIRVGLALDEGPPVIAGLFPKIDQPIASLAQRPKVKRT